MMNWTFSTGFKFDQNLRHCWLHRASTKSSAGFKENKDVISGFCDQGQLIYQSTIIAL